MVGAMGRRYRVVSSEVKSRSRSEPGNHRLGTGIFPTDVLNPEIILSRNPRAAFLVYVRGGYRSSLLWATTGYERTKYGMACDQHQDGLPSSNEMTAVNERPKSLPVQSMHDGSNSSFADAHGSVGGGPSKIVPLAEVERQTILSALERLNGNKLLTARALGIGKTTLYRKLKAYGICSS